MTSLLAGVWHAVLASTRREKHRSRASRVLTTSRAWVWSELPSSRSVQVRLMNNTTGHVHVNYIYTSYIPYSYTFKCIRCIRLAAQCVPGTYSQTGLKPCTECPLGTYQNQYGRVTCTSCGTGISTSRTGSTGFQYCQVSGIPVTS